jgi:hypothetical protein
MATKAGYKLLVDLAPLDVPYLRNVVAVSQKALREDSATIARFVEALSEGMRYYRDQRTAKRASAFWLNICGSRCKQIARWLEEGYETYRDMLLKKPYADPGAMKILLEVIGDSNPKARNLNLASLIDSSFVERLDQQGSFGN